MMKYILFGAICLLFALMWLSSESRRKKAEAQQACFEAACNIHLYAQLAAEEVADAAQKQKQQIILSETEKLLDFLKSDDK